MRTIQLPNSLARYEVQFQKTGQTHSEMDDLEKAKLYARSLANWNHAAQVFDRLSHTIIFSVPAYNASQGRGSSSADPSVTHSWFVEDSLPEPLHQGISLSFPGPTSASPCLGNEQRRR